jgi:ADP-ribosylglycohydrolase
MKEADYQEIVRGGILGVCVADALGVPVEFKDKEYLSLNPVTDMTGYGMFNKPPGTWSDDSSLTLCLLDSLTGGVDYADIMRKFLSWLEKAEYTPHGDVFDHGFTCRQSIIRFKFGIEPLKCGGADENDNGNGSLMRILPVAFYLRSLYGDNFVEHSEAFDLIHNISALTHAHARSKIACGIYIAVAGELMKTGDKTGGIYEGMNKAKSYYERSEKYIKDLAFYERIFKTDFYTMPGDEIKNGGYVVHALEAALWCLLNAESYEECVLSAVNLGDDTDTTAAIAGGLAGIFYGPGAIPAKWLNQIARLDFIVGLCDKFSAKYK